MRLLTFRRVAVSLDFGDRAGRATAANPVFGSFISWVIRERFFYVAFWTDFKARGQAFLSGQTVNPTLVAFAVFLLSFGGRAQFACFVSHAGLAVRCVTKSRLGSAPESIERFSFLTLRAKLGSIGNINSLARHCSSLSLSILNGYQGITPLSTPFSHEAQAHMQGA
jgi:hypothetical protein